MLVRQILFKIVSAAAQNPDVRRQAGKVATSTLEKSRPAILKTSRKLGQLTRAAGQEFKDGIDKFKKGKDTTSDE